METIKAILMGTPWWVYLLFFYLVSRGIAASKTRVVTLKQLAILPIVLSAWSIWDLLRFSHITIGLEWVFFSMLVVGALIGWRLVSSQKIEVVSLKNQELKMPGSWLTLVIILVIFATKYFFGFEMAADPNWVHHTTPLYSLFGISALTSGLLCGRLLSYLYHLWEAYQAR